jgi:hypothetical protein
MFDECIHGLEHQAVNALKNRKKYDSGSTTVARFT